MIKKGGYVDERAEELIDLLEGALSEEGYKTIRMSDTDRYSTSDYDCLIVKDWKYPGSVITLSVGNTGNEYLKHLFKKGGEGE